MRLGLIRNFIVFIAFTASLHVEAALQQELSLEQLLQQCEQARTLCHYDTLLHYSHTLLMRARARNNKRYEAYGLFYQGMSQLFSGKGKLSLQNLNAAKEMAESIDNDSIAALAMNSLAIYHVMAENNSFLAQQYFLRSLRLAEQANYEQLKGRIYGNLLVLTQAANDTTGLTNAQKIYDYGKKHKNYEQTFMGTYFLALYYNLRGDNTRAESFLQESLRLYQQHEYDDVAAVYTLYSKVKLEEGNRTEATNYAIEAIKLAKRYNQAGLQPDAYLQYATVLHENGDYQQSNEMAKKALELTERVDNHTKTVPCLELIAKNCRKLGETESAYIWMERANRAIDTLSRINMDRLMHERAIMLDVEQKEQEAQVRKLQMAEQRRLTIILFIVTLILATLLSIIVANYRRRNRLYKNIVKQNARAAEQQKQLQERINKLTEQAQKGVAAGSIIQQQADNSPQTLLQDEERMQDVYERACRLMEKDRIYTDSQLNRERMAELLGTNRTYLTRIIKEKSGMSYPQFVNSYRINEAIRILSDRSMTDYPLKQLATDLGFSSPGTFHKLFQQTVGITPTIYRKQFLDMEKEY